MSLCGESSWYEKLCSFSCNALMNLEVNSVFNYGKSTERHSKSLFTVTIGPVCAYISSTFSFLVDSLDSDASVLAETA